LQKLFLTAFWSTVGLAMVLLCGAVSATLINSVIPGFLSGYLLLFPLMRRFFFLPLKLIGVIV